MSIAIVRLVLPVKIVAPNVVAMPEQLFGHESRMRGLA